MNKPLRFATLKKIPSSIWALGFVSMLTDISSEMIHSLLPIFLVTTMGASAFTIGVIEGIAESTALILKVFSGSFSDYLGRRKGLTVAGYALSAAIKPIFPLATTVGVVLTARFLDRIGKGIRDAPRDALIVDITPTDMRGAAFGLRQTLDTIGAFLGPLLAAFLMLVWANDFRLVFWMATIPSAVAVLLVISIVKEKYSVNFGEKLPMLKWASLKLLPSRYWYVVSIGAFIGLSRFSDAFLVLRAFHSGIPLTLIPLIFVLMNVLYAATAYPFGKLSDTIGHTKLLAFGMLSLLLADLCFASGTQWLHVIGGVIFWGLHLGLTQGVVASMIGEVAPTQLRGTAYGIFNLVLGSSMLASSLTAGYIWDKWGAGYTFYASSIICLISLVFIVLLGFKRSLAITDAKP